MTFQIDTTTSIESQLRAQMLRLRKHVFCDELGWDIPHCEGQEADIFDFGSSYYLNWVDDLSGAFLGSIRLMPLMRDNLMTTVFRRTIAVERFGDVRRNCRVWEGTRLCLNDRLIEPEARTAALVTLLGGLFMACRAMGVEMLLCNCSSVKYRRYRSLGFHVEHLGVTREFRHDAVHCLGFEISEANLHALMRLSNSPELRQPVLRGEGIRVARAFTDGTPVAPLAASTHVPPAYIATDAVTGAPMALHA
ncbi:acyl-homoserine-lactone synthase [Fulvimarina sp. MAC3]|uniref:acyl-homoserine-lactone synthase n=1 Tax=Fulvimarina sp. MAC3 TaxID=3148887 RepID=UPI0031FDDDFD